MWNTGDEQNAKFKIQKKMKNGGVFCQMEKNVE